MMHSYRNGTPVRARPRHEGVGNALRSAYGRSINDFGLPTDMRDLLTRLD